MSFVRVRSSVPGDPQHEFDAPVRLVERYPDAYTVVDPAPVDAPRPVKYAVNLVVDLEPFEAAFEAAQSDPVTSRGRRRKKK